MGSVALRLINYVFMVVLNFYVDYVAMATF